MITHLEPDILKREVKWAIGNITASKASGGDGIPVELFQILKDDAGEALNISANLENSAVAEWTGKGQFSFQSQRKAMPKNDHTTAQLHSSQFSSVAQSRLTPCDPTNRSTPGLPVHHHLPEFTQTHVH